MYAVIEQGSKQYKVAEGDCIKIAQDLVIPLPPELKADPRRIISRHVRTDS